jgi:glycosyltransferase involved in cell wall biosynthesis
MGKLSQSSPAPPRSLEYLRVAFQAAGWKIFFDVSPMFDAEWTGIPTVAAGLAQALLDLPSDDTRFFFRHHLVNTAAVRDALRRDSGLYLARDFEQGHANAGALPILSDHDATIGLFPSVKLVSSLFTVECSIYHDISTFVLPQYHTQANIHHHIRGLADDIRTNTITFGVSQATVDDMICYLDAPPDATFVLRNGVSWPWWFPIQAANDGPVESGPYFVVLGTREPRKNLLLIWRALEMFPELLDQARLFIVGKKGWIQQDADAYPWVSRLIAQGRIVLTGYISNFHKYRLLRGAVATVYPSLFEGFGLPVLESLSVGTPCIASFSSAIPEVGGDACRYFDPLSVEDVANVMMQMLQQPPDPNGRPREPVREVAGMTWSNMLAEIFQRLETVLPAQAESHLV